MMRGLESRDFGVPECDRFFDASRDFVPGELPDVAVGFELLELRRREDSLKCSSSTMFRN